MAPIALLSEEDKAPPFIAKLPPYPVDASILNPFHDLVDKPGLDWSPSRSSSLYRVDGWGGSYFAVSSKGDVVVRPNGQSTKMSEEINIRQAIEQVLKPASMGGLGLTTPAILRFPHVLRHRLLSLQSSFEEAIKSRKFDGCYQGVFPVKCNQDRSVIDNIVEVGKPFAFGLEAGSKPELLLAMASLMKGSPNALLVCNGYKDAEYISLALIARLIQLNCIIVLEQQQELDLILSISRLLAIEPVIGLRAKLNTKHDGHFGDTSGEKGKFGLSCSEIVSIVNKLRSLNMLGSLQLLHFHIGSQIPSLAILNDGVSEAAQIYCELALMGANVRYIDIGGGLGIDYNGSSSATSDMSVEYSMAEYAHEVVGAVKDACDRKGVRHPTLCSESGRALVSHQSVLVFDVLSSSTASNRHLAAEGISLEVEALPVTLKSIHTSLIDAAKSCEYGAALECAKLLRRRCVELFKRGHLGLELLAHVESIYGVVQASWDQSKSSRADFDVDNEQGNGRRRADFHVDDEQGNSRLNVHKVHNAVYHVNISVFRSMPDSWAIHQLFPIIPLHRLSEQPRVRAILSDVTCDSDGKIASFVGGDEDQERINYLQLHELEEGKPYYLGMFLGGAYQEALGSLHNLFGAPCVVNVTKEAGADELKLGKSSNGQTTADVLRSMQHEPSAMLESLKLRLQRSISCSDRADARISGLVNTIACSFGSTTYLSTSNPMSSILSKGFLSAVLGQLSTSCS
ncbi:hypothetical protein KP509_31G061900 [Ceratopteris richardii]|uniref:Arginine decarboxylase n=1 Tax=Ceratopteris richardii TaxID=49495 RepID=A0A8T2QZC1_CERRI|nr:hypothetical protein KP509_31G061900 [Ceratopteris richardii]